MLGAVSWVAAVVGILAFLGYSADLVVKVGVGAALAVISIASAVSTLIPAILLWRSPRGAFYSGQYHAFRIAQATGALILASVVVAAIMQAVYK